MNDKIKTTIQYQLTNVKLFNEVFGNWKSFNSDLQKGPDFMKERFLKEWNELKNEIKTKENFIIQDIDKSVGKDDFDVTINKTKKGTYVFFFTFPDCDFKDAASKYVALVLSSNMPRYITLEYSKSIFSDKEVYIVGEFYIDRQTNKKIHKNYGQIDNKRLTYFAGYVLGMLDTENI